MKTQIASDETPRGNRWAAGATRMEASGRAPSERSGRNPNHDCQGPPVPHRPPSGRGTMKTRYRTKSGNASPEPMVGKEKTRTACWHGWRRIKCRLAPTPARFSHRRQGCARARRSHASPGLEGFCQLMRCGPGFALPRGQSETPIIPPAAEGFASCRSSLGIWDAP